MIVWLWFCARSTLSKLHPPNLYLLLRAPYHCAWNISAKIKGFVKQAHTLITGAVKTTLIDSILLFSGNQPLRVVFEEKCVVFSFTKKLMLAYFWSDYHCTSRKLKTQNGFIESIREWASRLNMDIPPPLKNQIRFTKPLDYFNLNIILCLE